MTNRNPLVVSVGVLADLTSLEREELFFLQKTFLPLQGRVAKVIEEKSNNHKKPKDTSVIDKQGKEAA